MKKLFLHSLGLFFFLFVFISCSDNDNDNNTKEAPLIVAHRGGKMDFPENTLLAFEKALEKGANAVEMDIQVTKDSVPVLYHPNNLSTWTEGEGIVADFTLADLKKLNFAWKYQPENGYPYLNLPQRIPTLKEALNAIPVTIPITLDMKSLPAAILVRNIAKVLDELNAWERVVFYSTSKEHLDYLKAWPKANVFEAREITRQRLLDYKINNKFTAPETQVSWIGFELQRTFAVSEQLTLGEGSSQVAINLWDKELIKMLKGDTHKVRIILFGINTKEDYLKAQELGADAVLTDTPALLTPIRAAM